MPSTLRAKLEALTSQFLDGIEAAISDMSFRDLAGASPHRVPSSKAFAKVKPAVAAPKPKTGKGGRLQRRSPEEIKAALDKVVGLVKKHPNISSEQIREALKMDVKELPRIIEEGLKTKKLSKKGEKRATRYFAR